MPPKAYYLAPEEERREARGVKCVKAKKRVTLKLCIIADGSKIVYCMVIGKTKRPNDF